MCFLNSISVNHSQSKGCANFTCSQPTWQIVKEHFFLRKEINFPPQMIKIEPGMEAGTAICLYVIFFFSSSAINYALPLF